MIVLELKYPLLTEFGGRAVSYRGPTWSSLPHQFMAHRAKRASLLAEALFLLFADGRKEKKKKKVSPVSEHQEKSLR